MVEASTVHKVKYHLQESALPAAKNPMDPQIGSINLDMVYNINVRGI